MQAKTEAGRKARMPTPAEDAAIQSGIDADPDAGERDDAFFASAKPAAELLGDATAEKLTSLRRPRGRPIGSVGERTKVPLTMRVDPDVLAAMRESGAGWQTRVNDILRREFLRGGRKPLHR